MKEIYISRFISTQEGLDNSIKIINGKIPIENRIKIYNDFNENKIKKISITESLIISGGVRYKRNGLEINVIFLDEFNNERKNFILSRMNIK